MKDDFVEQMNNSIKSGADVILSKREVKNWQFNDKSLRSIGCNCSAMTYTFLDKMGNAFRTRHNLPIVLCGTGMMISQNFAKLNNGWPYRSMTEDYECTADCVLRNIKMYYYEPAVTYTEEALSWKVNDKRRVRWMAGYQ